MAQHKELIHEIEITLQGEVCDIDTELEGMSKKTDKHAALTKRRARIVKSIQSVSKKAQGVDKQIKQLQDEIDKVEGPFMAQLNGIMSSLRLERQVHALARLSTDVMPCRAAALSCCCAVGVAALSYCCAVVLLRCRILPCRIAALWCCCAVVLLPCHAAALPCCCAAVLLRCGAAALS